MTVSQMQTYSSRKRPPQWDGEACSSYRIFDICLHSQFSLPELSTWGGTETSTSIKTFISCDPAPDDFTVCHDWETDAGLQVCRIARRKDQYLLSFPDRASFLIDPAGVISCSPVAGASDWLVRQLLLNQVLPCYLAHVGEVLLHASAVTLPDGKTVAFLGASGQGKSTLASYCEQQGAQLIDDDCILLRSVNGRLCIFGGVPTIRLLPDSLRALGHNPASFVPYVEHSDKQQKCLPAGSTPGLEPRALDELLLISEPGESLADAVAIEPIGGQAAIMAIVGGLFSLDPSDPATMAKNLSHASWVLAGAHGLQVKRLSYPRQHSYLPRVLKALSEEKGGTSRSDSAAL